MGHREDSKLALHRLEVRREMRSADLDEDSNVIEQAAQSRHAPPSSAPGPIKALIAVLNTLPKWSRPIVVIVLIAAVAFGGLAATWKSWF